MTTEYDKLVFGLNTMIQFMPNDDQKAILKDAAAAITELQKQLDDAIKIADERTNVFEDLNLRVKSLEDRDKEERAAMHQIGDHIESIDRKIEERTKHQITKFYGQE